MTKNEKASLIREQLESMVPVVGDLISLWDIPEPYRMDFFFDSMGSTLPDLQGHYYVRDWHRWLDIQFAPSIPTS
jgi:hypothetical protein